MVDNRSSVLEALAPNTPPYRGLELAARDICRLPAPRQLPFPHPAGPPALAHTLALQPDSLHAATRRYARTIPPPATTPSRLPAPAPDRAQPPPPKRQTEAYLPTPDDIDWVKLTFFLLCVNSLLPDGKTLTL